MVDTIIHNINNIVEEERLKKGLSNRTFLLTYKTRTENPTFKVYKKYEYRLVEVNPSLKTKKELLYYTKTEKVYAGKEDEVTKTIESGFINKILRFFRSEDFDKYINYGEVSKATVQ